MTADPTAPAGSSYLGVVDSRLVHVLDAQRRVTPKESEAHTVLRDLVLTEGYPCVGARSAVNRHQYRFGLYAALGCPAVCRALVHDLYEFSRENLSVQDEFVTFVAMFDAPDAMTEAGFEALMWQHLTQMHTIDTEHFGWDAEVASDPADARFSFSIGGRAYFIIGMHPQASRRARRTPVPLLVFNLHAQFVRLRERGKFEMMKTMIRARDLAFDGSINPVLTNHGERSEARQYAGRAVPDDWRCPFQTRPRFPL